MTKTQLEADIKSIARQLEDPKLPAGVRTALEKAQAKAQKMLDDEDYTAGPAKPKAAPKAAASKEKPGVTLDDCEEILARYRKEEKTAKKRREKRKDQGKPPELTVAETVRKAAKTVKKKVTDKQGDHKFLTAKEIISAKSALHEMFLNLLDGLEGSEKKQEFIDEWIEYLQSLKEDNPQSKPGNKKKAEKGTHLKGAQMRIFHYTTLHFDQSSAARQYFQRILNQGPVAERHKTLIINMARDVDHLLGKVSEIRHTDRFDKADFLNATGYLMRALYWCYGVVTEMEGQASMSHETYPGFLAADLYRVCEHVHGSRQAEDGAILEEVEIIEIKPEEMEEGGHLSPLPSYDDLSPEMQAYSDEVYRENMEAYYYKEGHPNSESLKKDMRKYIKTLDHISRQPNNSFNDKPEVQARVLAHQRFLADTDPRKKVAAPVLPAFDELNGEQRDIAAAEYDRYMDIFQKTKSANSRANLLQNVRNTVQSPMNDNLPDADKLIARRAGLKKFLHEVAAVKEKGGQFTGRHPGIHYEEGDRVVESLSDDQLAQVNSSLSNDEETTDAEIATLWAGMGIPRKTGKHIVAKYRQKFRTDPLFELEKGTYKKGGKTKFADKVREIAGKLEGKAVPKKYQKTEGKRFTQKSATAAAKRIVGKEVKNEKKKGTKKMLLGGVALYTPPNISSLGDQNNLDIHG